MLNNYDYGVSFIGSFIKPNRFYLGKRTFEGFYEALGFAERYCKTNYLHLTLKNVDKFQHIQCTLNSYLGFTRYNKSYLKKIDLLRDKEYLWKVFDIDMNLTKFKLRKGYRLKDKIYGKYNRTRINKKTRVVSKLRRSEWHK